MDVREAVARAKTYVSDVFAEQSVSNLTADIDDTALVTDDHDLYLAALYSCRPALNFSHLRAAR